MHRSRGPQILFCILIILVSGCVNTNANLSPESNPTRTTVLTTIPVECRELTEAADDDMDFLDFIDHHDIVISVYNLAYSNCTVADASGLNQLIAAHPQPKSIQLLQARQALKSATTHCIEGKTSATRGIIGDIETFRGKLEDYKTAVAPCHVYMKEDPTGHIQEILDALNYQKGEAFSGKGDDRVSFRATTGEMLVFHSEYSGKNLFVVQILNEQGTVGKTLFNFTTPQSGSTGMWLGPGNYDLNIQSDGPWTMTIRKE
jgi:hypothetical protein